MVNLLVSDTVAFQANYIGCKMKNIMKRNYDFYERGCYANRTLVGEALKFGDETSTWYVVFQWDGMSIDMNYGREIGLVSVTNICNDPCGKSRRKYFNVGVFSPDDWDYQITIYDRTDIRFDIIDWLKKTARKGPIEHKVLFDKLIDKFDLDRKQLFR